MNNKYKTLYKYQRTWREKIINNLKLKIGYWCHGCQSPESILLEDDVRHWLHLVIRNRSAADLEHYKNNTFQIYKDILHGKLPMDRVTLLCSQCRYDLKAEERYESKTGA